MIHAGLALLIVLEGRGGGVLVLVSIGGIPVRLGPGTGENCSSSGGTPSRSGEYVPAVVEHVPALTKHVPALVEEFPSLVEDFPALVEDVPALVEGVQFCGSLSNMYSPRPGPTLSKLVMY